MSITEISNGCALVDQTLCVRDVFPMKFIEELVEEMNSVRDGNHTRYYELSSILRYNRRPQYDIEKVKNIPIGETIKINGLNIQRVSKNLCISVA